MRLIFKATFLLLCNKVGFYHLPAKCVRKINSYPQIKRVFFVIIITKYRIPPSLSLANIENLFYHSKINTD